MKRRRRFNNLRQLHDLCSLQFDFLVYSPILVRKTGGHTYEKGRMCFNISQVRIGNKKGGGGGGREDSISGMIW